MQRYPVPTEPPRYVEPPRKVDGRGRIPVYEALAALFVVVALATTVWLAVLLLRVGVPSSGAWVVNLILFWIVLTYLALPRLHQVFTFLYVPGYFIGRTRTGDGLLGDPVNLALDGTADDVHAAMRRAGWTKADPITLRSSVGIVRSTLLRRPYPEAPVSDLLLFGHPQAFAYQQEVDGNAAQRHHVRFWPTPEGWLLPGGERVDWLAGATYDRSVGLSLFTLQVTHKIDADIDIERDYVVNTVRYADPACGVRVLADFTTAYHARNGGGDAISTDGDLPVLDVSGAAARSGEPAQVPVEPALADQELPPRGLLFAGVIVAALVVFGLVELVLHAEDAVPDIVAALLFAVTWAFAMARHRWAWLVLMGLASVVALATLGMVTASRWQGEGVLLLAGLAVLVVLAVSSEDVREWLARGRDEPSLPSSIPDGDVLDL